MIKREISCHTCNKCGKNYDDHDFLCSDDICVECHGGLDQFLECDMRHFFLMSTQCMNLTFRDGTPILSQKELKKYDDHIEYITKVSMGVIRNMVDFIRKYDKENELDEK